jgi:O-antigen/teichoic acid export membrane protein
MLWTYKISREEVKSIIFRNWPFLVISSVSIVYWRIGNIIISKTLSLLDVAMYEISFRLFSVAQILPIVISSSLFPHLIKLYNTGDKMKFSSLYRKYFYLFLLYGLLMYTFIYSFADQIIPFVFGGKYLITPVYAKQMFLTILLFPTAIYQAILLISMKLERVDMSINLISLAISVMSIMIGLSFSKSLSVINYSIFISFTVFHLCQDVILVNKQVTTVKAVFQFYIFIAVFTLGYIWLASKVSHVIAFSAIWGLAAVIGLITLALKTGSRAVALNEDNLV